MAFSRETVAAVKQQADIVQIVGEKVSLAPSGANFKGLCPFHSEKSPSFMVNPQRGMYHCFGCGAGGSVIDFLMAYENITFPEAVTTLAQRLGIALEQGAPSAPASRAQELLHEAEGVYHETLLHLPEGEPARRYLRARGFEEDAWAAFKMGYARDGWQGLTDIANAKGFGLEDQLASGLIKQSSGGNTYDMLRKRVVFPIRDARGGCIAFGGRSIDAEDSPKYLNTPETRLYHKSQVLFGLAEGRETLRKSRRAILAEGYLDVIRMHMAGFSEALATCGTALTPDHLTLLERHADQVLLVFDGDDAGVKAALRSAPLFLNHGIEARVVTLPDGLDPDDFIVQRGADAFAQALEAATPILEYTVWRTLNNHGNSPAGKERTLQELLPLLSGIRTDSARDMTVRYMADLVGVRAEDISRMLRSQGGAPKGGASHGSSTQGRASQAAPAEAFSFTARESRHQRMFLRLLLNERKLIAKARELLKPEEFAEPELRQLYDKILRLGDEEFQQLDPQEMGELYPDVAPSIREVLMEGLHDGPPGSREGELQYEIALIKNALKQQLFLKLKQVTGKEEEELALRRYTKVREELRALKSIPASRSALYDNEKSVNHKQRIYQGQVPFPDGISRGASRSRRDKPETETPVVPASPPA